MIKQNILLLIIFLSGKSLAQQTSETPALPKKYELVKVTGGEFPVTPGSKLNELSMITVSSQAEIDFYKQKYKLSTGLHDTLITMDWDITKEGFGKQPDMGLFKLLAGNKVTIKKSALSSENKKIIREYTFKIFKWNGGSIVMQNISPGAKEVVYTFKAVD
jgi:hypothetical protein